MKNPAHGHVSRYNHFDSPTSHRVHTSLGEIRHVALSKVTREHIDRARRIVPIVSVQNRYSFADRESDYIVDYCEQNNIAFLPWAPLGQAKEAHEAIRKYRMT